MCQNGINTGIVKGKVKETLKCLYIAEGKQPDALAVHVMVKYWWWAGLILLRDSTRYWWPGIGACLLAWHR